MPRRVRCPEAHGTPRCSCGRHRGAGHPVPSDRAVPGIEKASDILAICLPSVFGQSANPPAYAAPSPPRLDGLGTPRRRTLPREPYTPRLIQPGCWNQDGLRRLKRFTPDLDPPYDAKKSGAYPVLRIGLHTWATTRCPPRVPAYVHVMRARKSSR